MKKPRKKNIRRDSSTFVETIRMADRHAREIANRPANNRHMRHIQASLADDASFDFPTLPFHARFLRWMIAIFLIPFCLVTSCTFGAMFAEQSMDRNFWTSNEFWFFATGGVCMVGWFFTGLLRNVFLYFYVLGHEITHAVFVWLHLGKVTEFRVSKNGGYITTNKSNTIISLSPYFVPFWSCIVLLLYPLLNLLIELPKESEKVLYFFTGFTWVYHILWTLWMIPRDQPDLKENDTFFSLIIIYLMNMILLSVLLCMASRNLTVHDYLASWFIHAESFYRMASEWIITQVNA